MSAFAIKISLNEIDTCWAGRHVVSVAYYTLERIAAGIETLLAEPDDLRHTLSLPERKPGLHTKLWLLLQRVEEERNGLQSVLIEVRNEESNR